MHVSCSINYIDIDMPSFPSKSLLLIVIYACTSCASLTRQTVTWPGCKWKAIGLGDVLSPAQVMLLTILFM